MGKQVISESFHVHSLITSNDESSSVLMVEMNNKEDFQEPISQLQNVVNQEPVGKGSSQLDDSFIHSGRDFFLRFSKRGGAGTCEST
ncbi:uncharacterized protein LOC113274422 isoform X2 [Papaver somniferum]|uniref:uncharacterized protein LOC113274422 isoform X2 n=1 Tax=Papaver somniferum TaxID=3469 RepID=UPI000E6FECBB|nr:uncharacterized protein LOC113274422 isoform X2 [Papaver somniferum]